MRNRETDLLRPTDALNHNKQINFADDNLMGAILVQKKRQLKKSQLSSVKHLKTKLNLERLNLNIEGRYKNTLNQNIFLSVLQEIKSDVCSVRMAFSVLPQWVLKRTSASSTGLKLTCL